MAASDSSIITCFVLNIITCVICFIIFSYLRLNDHSKRFYAPRRFAKDIRLKPRRLPVRGFLTWIWPIWTYTEGEIIDEAGLDTAIYLRILTFGLYLFSFISFWCLIAVLPINLTGNEIKNLEAKHGKEGDKGFKFTNFDKCSLSNVEPGSSKLWMHFASVYVVSCFCLWLLWKFNRDSVNLRVLFLARSKPGGPTHTVLVTDIPGITLPSKETGLMAKVKSTLSRGHNNDGDAANSRGAGAAASSKPDELGTAFVQDDGSSAAASSVAKSSVPESQHPEKVPAARDTLALEVARTESEILDMDGRRRRRSYNVRSPELDATNKAVAQLASGMSPKEMIEAEFRGVYPEGAVVAVNTVNDQASLEPLVDEYDDIRQRLDDYLDECTHRMDRGIHVKRKTILVLGSKGEWGKARGYKLWNKPDAIEHWTARLEELSRLITRKQQQCRKRVTSTAFVTFSTRVAQCTAASSLHYHDETCWRTQNAPEPFELVWHNLAMRLPERTTRQLVLLAAFVVMTLFFMIPVAAIQGMIDVPKLASNPALKDFVNAPVIKQFLQAIIPGLALVVFLALVPTILVHMMRFAGAKSLSEIDFGVVSRFFVFQVVVVFFFNVIGGSFFSQLQQWVNEPSRAISILGTAIPVVSTFFITYIVINGIGKASIGLLRVVPLVLHWLLTKLAGSPKAQMRVWSEQYTTYGTSVTDHTMTTLLGVVYCLINPIIAPTALAHFVVNSVIERYQNIYVWRRKYESGGRMWERVFHQVMFALYLFQICMLGLLGIKKFKYTPLLIPMPIITLLYHLATNFVFDRPWALAAQHDAAELDRRERAVQQQQQQRLLAPGAVDAETLQQRQQEQTLHAQQVEEAAQRVVGTGGGGFHGANDLMRDLGDSADPDGADGPEEPQEPVEIAYLSRVFKVELPEDMADLLRQAEVTAQRIAAQPQPPTKQEAKAAKRAARALAKEAAREQKAAAKEEKATAKGGRSSAPGTYADAEAQPPSAFNNPLASGAAARFANQPGVGYNPPAQSAV